MCKAISFAGWLFFLLPIIFFPPPDILAFGNRQPARERFTRLNLFCFDFSLSLPFLFHSQYSTLSNALIPLIKFSSSFILCRRFFAFYPWHIKRIFQLLPLGLWLSPVVYRERRAPSNALTFLSLHSVFPLLRLRLSLGRIFVLVLSFCAIASTRYTSCNVITW